MDPTPARCAFIGDEVSAVGFRLAGVAVHSPDPAQAPGLFERLRGEAALVLVTQEALAWVGEGAVRAAIRAGRPLVLVIPDVRGRHKPPDIGEAIRRQLGMATSRDGLASREAGAGRDETSREQGASEEEGAKRNEAGAGPSRPAASEVNEP
jgi:vacuolar-type H+-ATPase subunit F/Vma7